ncbi:hypothetical protein B0H12DRAFT_1069149 [Mycena haematopus]|nr:hypothetical protein B0H12DRAFT_1069149 [Mycena haematopus]
MAFTSSEQTFQKSETEGSDAVLKFLESCRPSLPRLFGAFVAAGICNRTHLVGLSTCSAPTQRDFIRSSITDRGGTPLTPFLVEVLVVKLCHQSCKCGHCADFGDPHCDVGEANTLPPESTIPSIESLTIDDAT